MTAYAIVEMAITNLDAMLPYIAAAPATIAAHGGHYVARPGMAQYRSTRKYRQCTIIE